jgi:cytochrome bd-type quinol oxidase subunit 2
MNTTAAGRRSLAIPLALTALFASAYFFAAIPAGATDYTGLEETAKEAKLKTRETDVNKLVGQIVRSLLSFVGVLLLVLFIYAGFLWMTAQGNEEQVTKAKNIIKGATIGAVLVFASYALTNFVLQSLETAGL